MERLIDILLLDYTQARRIGKYFLDKWKENGNSSASIGATRDFLAWGMGRKINYVLEGNINYTGAVITWLEKELKLIASSKETEKHAREASLEDKAYLVPAFTGLGAPYWDSRAAGILCGITRTTGQKEVVRAALDCIAYQITDIIKDFGV